MKHIKMFGLAAIAALGLMAFVGAGTASATTLATDTAGTIHYAVGTTVHSTLEKGTSATLTDTSGNTIATCTGSTVHGILTGPGVNTNTTTFASGTWVEGSIESLTWEGCNQTTDTLVGGKLDIDRIGKNDEGTIRGTGTKVTINIFGVSCVYGTGEGTDLGTITGGEAPTLKITATIPRIEGGFLCPSTGIWHASYIVTTPHVIHIVD